MAEPPPLGGLPGKIVAVHEALDAAGLSHAFGGALALAWCTERARTVTAQGPQQIDLTGGLAGAKLDLAALAKDAHAEAEAAEAAEAKAEDGNMIAALPAPPTLSSKLPTPEWGSVTADLDDMVVIVGAGELGPYGSARTRFEMEVEDQLSAAGVVELAWTTGLLIGRHKLIPWVSPKKTIEGAIGGVLFSSAVALLFWHGHAWTEPEMTPVVRGVPVEGEPEAARAEPVGEMGSRSAALLHEMTRNIAMLGRWQVLIFGILMSISGQVGDLLESCFKRAAGGSPDHPLGARFASAW